MDIVQALISSLPKLSTGDICDSGRDQVGVMDMNIKPLMSSMRAVGPAFTVKTPVGANLAIFKAIAQAPAGSVLVIDAYGDDTAGHIGDMVAQNCQAQGLAGLVINGAVRDIDSIMDLGFPVFSTGAYPHSDRLEDGSTNLPITCGGVDVNPGDIIFGDATGVVVIPPAKAEAIYNQAVKISLCELGVVQKLNEGQSLIEIPEFLQIHHLDPEELKK